MGIEKLRKLSTPTLRLRVWKLGPMITRSFGSQAAAKAHARSEFYIPLANRIEEYDSIRDILQNRLGENGLNEWVNYCNDHKLAIDHSGFDCGA